MTRSDDYNALIDRVPITPMNIFIIIYLLCYLCRPAGGRVQVPVHVPAGEANVE